MPVFTCLHDKQKNYIGTYYFLRNTIIFSLLVNRRINIIKYVLPYFYCYIFYLYFLLIINISFNISLACKCSSNKAYQHCSCIQRSKWPWPLRTCHNILWLLTIWIIYAICIISKCNYHIERSRWRNCDPFIGYVYCISRMGAHLFSALFCFILFTDIKIRRLYTLRD